MAEQIRQAHGERYASGRGGARVAARPRRMTSKRAWTVIPPARTCSARNGTTRPCPRALNEQLADCRADLEGFGVHFDVWFSERSPTRRAWWPARSKAGEGGQIYAGRRQVVPFRPASATRRTASSSATTAYTYFASDIAYHLNKFERGFDKVIDVWGADHHGYIPRVKGALQALGCRRRQVDGL